MSENLPIDAAIIDIDGVLFKESTPIQGAEEALQSLASRNTRFTFVSNNVSRARAEVLQRIEGMASERPIVLVDPIDVLMNCFIEERTDIARKFFVMGSRALKEWLAKSGLDIVRSDSLADAKALFFSSTVDFELLAEAANAVRNGAGLSASGRDSTFLWRDKLWPETGALVAAIEAASQSRATILGKPSARIFPWLGFIR